MHLIVQGFLRGGGEIGPIFGELKQLSLRNV
jgi:hypothetical protein